MRLLPYVKIRWRRTAAAYACVFAMLTFNLLQPFVFLLLIDRVLVGRETELLGPLLAVSGGLALASAALGVVRAGLFRYLGIRHTLDLREVILAHLRRIPMTEIERVGAGKYTALMGMDTATMGNFLNHVVVELASQAYSLVFAVGVIFYMDWRLGAAALIFIPVLMAIPRLFRQAIARNTGHVRAHNEEIGTYLYESIEGSREIRVHGLEQWERERNERQYRHLVRASVMDTLYRVMSASFGSLAVSAVIVLLYAFGSGRVLDGAMTLGVLVALVQYMNNALAPVQAMNGFIGELQAGEVAMERIEAFLRSPTEAAADVSDDGPEADEWKPEVAAAGLEVTKEGHGILRGVDFNVKYGEFAAFVGRSGAGKSTVFRTLLGFMEPTGGHMRIGSLPHGCWSRGFLSRRLGVVFQESFLFAGTIGENIRMGRLNASDEEVYEAACLAELKPLIDSLPEGLNTSIGYRGAQLSGGQRQRIAIARVLLQQPDILILDEPTSALDRSTETRILSAIGKAMAGKTVLMSTHRLDTVESADTIYVLEQGEVASAGKHAELLRSSAEYGELIKRQEQAGQERVPV
jgi:ABC-type bacteriocin/lantibiotic exporter with double-glycine peptidase domain